MKSHRIILLLCSAMLMSCGVGLKLPPVEFDLMERVESGEVQKQLLSTSKSDTLVSTIHYSYYSKVDSLFKDSVNAKVQHFIVEHASFSSAPILEPMSRAFVVHQLDSFERLYETEVKEYGGDYDAPIWNLEMSIDINETATEFVRVDLGMWSYTGGAHGNGFSQIHQIDRKTGAVLKLSDFFSNVEELTKVGENYFRLSQDLGASDDLTEAGFWFENGVFHLNEHFSFAGNTLLFFYNQYEIAPYSAGTIEFEIPMDKVKHLLKRKID